MATRTMFGMNTDYNANSQPQMAALIASKPYICQAINVFDPSFVSTIMIADFGSSQGLNSMHVIKEIIRFLLFLMIYRRMTGQHYLNLCIKKRPIFLWQVADHFTNNVYHQIPSQSGILRQLFIGCHVVHAKFLTIVLSCFHVSIKLGLSSNNQGSSGCS